MVSFYGLMRDIRLPFYYLITIRRNKLSNNLLPFNSHINQ